MFLGSIDPDLVKHQQERVAWDPVVRKLLLKSRSRGGSESEMTGHTVSQGEAEANSTGTSEAESESGCTDRVTSRVVGKSQVQAQGESRSEQWSESDQRSHTSTSSWSESEQEAYQTFYRKRIEKLPPQFRPLEEQIFDYAKRLRLSPRGQGTLVRPGLAPQTFKAPFRPDIELADDDMEAFLDVVYAKPSYLEPDAVDRMLEERHRKLLADATSGPRVVTSRSGRARKKEETTVVDGLFGPDRKED
jgi:hypothetical protein